MSVRAGSGAVARPAADVIPQSHSHGRREGVTYQVVCSRHQTVRAAPNGLQVHVAHIHLEFRRAEHELAAHDDAARSNLPTAISENDAAFVAGMPPRTEPPGLASARITHARLRYSAPPARNVDERGTPCGSHGGSLTTLPLLSRPMSCSLTPSACPHHTATRHQNRTIHRRARRMA